MDSFIYILTLCVAGCLCAPNPQLHDSLHAKSQPTEKFTNYEVLDKDGNYELFWKYNKTHITFETHVKTLGYVGFGLSPHGQMFPADIVIGWVRDGVAHFKDRHSIGKYEPLIDQSQDWFLLLGKEENDKTILKFTRKLKLCDKDDTSIEDGTVKIIYTWYPTDPDHETGLTYHGPKNRGSKSVLLLSPTQHRHLPPDSQHFDFVNRQFSLPADLTHYHCTAYKLPPLGGKHHMVMFEPVLQTGNEDVVHHIVVYRCPEYRKYNSSLIGIEYECYERTPRELQECTTATFLAWAVGGGPYYFPDDVGMPIGESDDTVYILETHYNNPSFRSDIIDSSGIRIHYTPTLKPIDGDILLTGMSVQPLQVIPPGYTDFISSGYCTSDCTNRFLKDHPEGVNIFGIFPHSHLLGNAVRARIIRNGEEMVISDDEHYDFDYQETRQLNEYVKLKPGDAIKVECLYKSDHKKTVTYGGLSTDEEMCLIFLMYYPRANFGSCSSIPIYNQYIDNPGNVAELMKTVSSMDWTNQTIRNKFQQDTEETKYIMACVGKDGFKSFLSQTTLVPKITKKYVKPDVCEKSQITIG